MSKGKYKERNVGESQEELRLNPIIISVAIILLITIILSLVIVLLQRIDEPASSYCLKPACVISASKLLHTIDQNVDPCEDFYNYTCGSYLKKAKEENTTVDVDKWLKRVKNQYNEIYTEKPKDSDELPHQNLKRLYGLCMDGEKRKNGMEYMNRILKRLGGWPILEKDWKPSDFYWQNMIVKLRQQGLYHDIFLQLSLFANQKNTNNRNYLQIAPTYRFREDHDVRNVRETYYSKYMADIAIAFGADSKKALHEANETYEFSEKLNEIYFDYITFVGVSNLVKTPVITMKELQERTPQLNWIEFTNQILHPYKIKETDLVVDKRIHRFMEDFDKLINNTTKRVQANYMIWLAIFHTLNWLPQELNELNIKDEQRFDFCLTEISLSFPHVGFALYSKKYAPKKSRAKVRAIVMEVREEYRVILRDNTWMDEDAKRFALRKLDAMKHVIGGHEDEDEDILQQLYYAYEDISSSENYLEFILKIRREVINFMYSSLNKPSRFTNMLNNLRLAISVNTFFSQKNIMYLPAAILQDMVYNSDFPNYMHYALLAYLAGHEFAHAFTEMANEYGIEGEHNEWWSDRTAENYKKSTQCLVDIYENYTKNHLGYQLNGTLALDENMADMLGTRVAYKLFVDNYQKDYSAVLPGFENFTTNQLFWIANSRFYCERQERWKILSDSTHGVYSFRIVVPSAHLGYFAKDFNCELGTRMNPVEKCDVL